MVLKDSFVGFSLVLIASCLPLACEERSDEAKTPPAQQPLVELNDPRLDEAIQLVSARQYSAARTILEKLRVSHPNAARVSFVLALTYHKVGLYDLARYHY